jgi:hypothetical protein
VWTIEEDEAIRQMVMKYGTKSWALIAENLSKEHSIAGRSGKQCRERWHNHLGKLFYIALTTNLLLDQPLNPLFVLLAIATAPQTRTSTNRTGRKRRRGSCRRRTRSLATSGQKSRRDCRAAQTIT